MKKLIPALVFFAAVVPLAVALLPPPFFPPQPENASATNRISAPVGPNTLAATNTVTDPTSATVSGPNVVVVSNTAVTVIAARTNDPAGHSFLRVMQNVGTQPVLFALGSTAAVTNYHGILAASGATRDGLGSLVDLSYWRGTVSVMCESSTGAVATVEILK